MNFELLSSKIRSYEPKYAQLVTRHSLLVAPVRLINVAVASVNTTVGAVRSNTDKAIRFALDAGSRGATLCALPEQLIGGYPAEDLTQWGRFITAQREELDRFARETDSTRTVFAIGMTADHGGHRFNCAAVVHAGKILALVPKEKLANYNVFYEERTFTKGGPGFFAESGGVPLGDYIFRFDFGTVAFEVCEDLWSPDGPLIRRAAAGAELAVNLSASPYRLGVHETRRELLATRSADAQCALVYANAVGGNDNLVFDGGGMIWQNGRLFLATPRFVEGLWDTTLDLDRTTRLRAENSTLRYDWEARRSAAEASRVMTIDTSTPERSALKFTRPQGKSFFLPRAGEKESADDRFCEEVLSALALGTGDYFEKNGCFKRIGVALSGGRDSLLTLLVAHRYAASRADGGKGILHAFTMPSQHTTDATRGAAETICRELDVPLKVVPIADAYERELAAVRQMLPAGEEPSALTLQNIQTRIRAARMWNWANSESALWLHTGNMSEKAVGYTTIGGDLEGGFSVLSNIPKTLVIHLLEYLLRRTKLEGIAMTMATMPGPELAADQSGEAELMPYAILDACFYLHAAEKYTPPEMIEALAAIFPEHDRAALDGWVRRFVRMFGNAIYKWVQAPMAVHIGNLDLDRERALQLPVVKKSEWME